MLYDVSVLFHFQNNCKPLEELKISTVQDGVLKEFPALVNICEYMNINIFIEFIRNDSWLRHSATSRKVALWPWG
jgi:hypothetical protein